MKVHVTNLYGQSPLSVALMAQNMVSDIAKKMGHHEIGIYSFNADGESYHDLMVRFDGMNAAVSNGDTIIFQSPSWNGTQFDFEYIRRLKIYSDIKIVIFIHDVHPLMFSSNFYLMEKTIEMYNLADLIIVPSKKMLSVLRENGLQVKKVLFQNFWDHVTDAWIEKPVNYRHISFIGSPERFHFVNDWKYSLPLQLFAPEQPKQDEINVTYHGWKYKVTLLNELNRLGGFGLVWTQGLDSDYYNLNTSYKLSTYIAAGLPVIIPKTLASASIVEEKGVGIVVSTLDEAVHIVEQMTPELYEQYLKNVWRFRELITQGYYAKKLLVDAVHEVCS